MTLKTSDKTVPHIGVNYVPGSNRQFVHTDMLAVVTKAMPTTEFNQAGSELITLVPSSDNTVALRRALVSAAKKTGLPIFKAA